MMLNINIQKILLDWAKCSFWRIINFPGSTRILETRGRNEEEKSLFIIDRVFFWTLFIFFLFLFQECVFDVGRFMSRIVLTFHLKNEIWGSEAHYVKFFKLGAAKTISQITGYTYMSRVSSILVESGKISSQFTRKYRCNKISPTNIQTTTQ